ncbi:hypothetical protein AADR41_00235 [Streptomyces sp. CLV115]|uniref:hypothetical protein n=1 Tax=Streptomyces sp. CLV115 TaxID=3138502 RepID=UPI00313F35A0
MRGSAGNPACAFTASARTRADLTGVASARVASAGIAEDALDDVHRTVRRP